MDKNQIIPYFLEDMLKEQYGEKTTKRIIEGYSQRRVISFRVNNLKNNYKKIEEVLNEKNIKFEKIIWSKDAFILKDVSQNVI